ncbi:MAG: hypothetical protein QXL67_03020 [Candidatus Bathyarchaeia archaeon]
MESSRRKMLAANELLVDEFVKVAERKGRVLYDFTNEVLTQAVRADRMGLSLSEVLSERGIVEEAKRAGFTLVFKRLWYEVIDKVYQSSEREWLIRAWDEAGQWYGKLSYSKLPERPLKALKEGITTLMWDIDDFDVTEEGNSASLRCISTGFSEAYTKLLTVFFRGAFAALSYDVVGEAVSKGIITLSFKKKGV